jgi:hypothetical protein
MVAGCSALVACGSDPHSSGSSSSDSQLGKVSAQLQAVGPDGATYALNGESLNVTLVGSDAGVTSLQFTPGLTSQAFSLPPGNYQAVMQGASGMGGQYPLTRTGDAGAATVTALLTDTQPINFTINSGVTTPLTFHFSIQSVGNLTFGTGMLNTSIAVANSDGGSPAAGTLTSNVFLNNVALLQPNGSVPNAGIKSMLSASGALPTTFAFNMSFTITGPFVAGIDNTCAPIQTPFVTMPVNNVNALFEEATNGTGTLCFYDSNGYNLPAFQWGQAVQGPVANAVVLTMTRTGTPQTPAGMMALASGPSTATFTDIVIATPSAPIYNGTTASLAALQTATTLNLTQSLMGFDVGLSDQVVTAGTFDPTKPTLTLQLSP